jgi:hypothetical protein
MSKLPTTSSIVRTPELRSSVGVLAKQPPTMQYKPLVANKPTTNNNIPIPPSNDNINGLNETSNTELKTKDQLIEKIKEWVKIDNEIRVLQKEQRKRLADKKKVSGELMQVMRSNDIDAFDLNDGQILYDKRNQKKPITKTALLSILTSYYKGDAVKASETNQYILDNREEVVREKIVRKITNPKVPKNAET